jgi:molybdopterin adenylyltransferase
MSFRVGILTVSDKGAAGEREDLSGDEVEKLVREQGWEVAKRDIVPDDPESIKLKLIEYSDLEAMDLVLTTGGTGLSPRDVTPDVSRELFTREAPGFAEAMRSASMTITPHAMLSRAVSGIRGCTLIINLPGSPKGARENLEVILPALPHGLEKLQGSPTECAM